MPCSSCVTSDNIKCLLFRHPAAVPILIVVRVKLVGVVVVVIVVVVVVIVVVVVVDIVVVVFFFIGRRSRIAHFE
jgi:hypothetical protein